MMAMKLTTWIATLISLLLVATLAMSDGIAPATHTVKPGESIQAAVDKAAPGDIIVVHRGTYQVHEITIRKPLTLMGKDRPILDGGGQGNILLIAAHGVTIRGLELRNTGRSNLNDPAGIKFFDSKHCLVEDNILTQTFFGIHFSNSSDNIVRNNRLVSEAEKEYMTGNGIHFWKSKRNRVEDNYIRGHRDGIYLEFVTDTECLHNVVEFNKRYGLHFMFSHDNSYLHNTFRSNGAGVAVMYTRNVVMKYNRFEQNQGPSSYGILLKDISDSEVRHNWFHSNTVGIYMEGSSRISFVGNEFRQNGSAIKLMASCDNNTFEANNFIGNTFDVGTNGSVVLNSLKLNYWDKYEGYDLNRDGIGDVPYRPISLYGSIIERIPAAVVLWRSFMVALLDRSEKVLPAITPENMKDEQPSMKPYDIDKKVK
jgi:nitrous oxidase accessory protein